MKKFVQHGLITIATDCNGHCLLIFKVKWPNYSLGSKLTANSNSFWVCRLFNVWVRVFCAPKCDSFACLHTHPRSKWTSFEKMIFFIKICIFCKSIAGSLNEAKTHWMVNWIQQNSSQWCNRNVQLLRITVNFSNLYTIIFAEREDKTNYISNQTWP